MTEYTVPCFIWHTFEDRTVPVQNSVRMAEALHEKGIRTELHLFQKGSHGLGSAGEESRRADGSGVQESEAERQRISQNIESSQDDCRLRGGGYGQRSPCQRSGLLQAAEQQCAACRIFLKPGV